MVVPLATWLSVRSEKWKYQVLHKAQYESLRAGLFGALG